MMNFQYGKFKLNFNDLNKDPFLQFQQWYEQAIDNNLPEPNAMILSTATTDGNVSSRVVLLKEIKQNSFIFFTNYISKKAKAIEQNPKVSLLFYYPYFERQIRVEGWVNKISEEESDKYFAQRPRESQIGAWASLQSTEIDDRNFLEEKFNYFTHLFEGKDIPRPEIWGGYAVTPHYFEFWQGREHRLHDRFAYSLSNTNQWIIKRLSP